MNVFVKLAPPLVIEAAQYLFEFIPPNKLPAVPPVAASKTSALTVTVPDAVIVKFTNSNALIPDLPTGNTSC